MSFSISQLVTKLRSATCPRRALVLLPPVDAADGGEPGFRAVEKSRTLASRVIEKRYGYCVTFVALRRGKSVRCVGWLSNIVRRCLWMSPWDE